MPYQLILLSVFLGFFGFIFGLYQYYKAEKWKKSEFAASLLEQLSNNPDLSLCCIFLDWKERKIAVPEKYKFFTSEASFIHNWDHLTKALRPKENDANLDFPLVLYRDVFDQFFKYLDKINHYIKIGLIEVKDVQILEHWLNELKNSNYKIQDANNVDEINPFLEFINTYNYNGTKNLLGLPEAMYISKTIVKG
jgi:hypothetical protein